MKFFNIDSPLMVFLTKVANLMILNLLVIICSLPIVTCGAAITAMYYVTLKMAKNEDPYIVRNFFKSFVQNLKQSTVIWLILLVFGVALYLDWQIAVQTLSGTLLTVMKVVLLVVIFAALMGVVYVFPLLSRFENTIRTTVKNAFLISLVNLPKTIMLMVLHLLPVTMILISEQLVPVVFMLGIPMVAYICSMVLVKIFERYEPGKEEILTPEEAYEPLPFMMEENAEAEGEEQAENTAEAVLENVEELPAAEKNESAE